MKLKSIIKEKRGKLIAVCTGIAVIALTGILYFKSQTGMAREEKRETLRIISDLKIKQIVSWKNERLGDAYVLANSPIFMNTVKAWIMNKSDEKLKAMISRRLEVFKEAFGYNNLFIASPEGKVMLTVEPGFSVSDQLTVDFIKKAVSENRELYTDFYYCRAHSAIHFDIIAPLSSGSKKIHAVLVLRVDPERNIYPLFQSWPTPSKTAESLLVKRDGDDVLFLNRLRHYDNRDLSFRIPLSKENLPASIAIRGYTGFFEGIDYRGVEVLAYVGKVPDTDWFIISKIDRSEIYSDLYYRQYFIIIFMVLSFMTLIAVISYVSHYRETEFYRRLYTHEKELKEKEEEFRTILYSIGDAVIITDVDGAVRNINKAAEILTGRGEHEVSGRKLDEVFEILNEETLEKAEDPVEKVINRRALTGLVNRTLLVNRSGMRIPIAGSGSPVMDESGKITGVVLVFRNQTQEREARLKLMQSEARFRSALDDMLEGCQIIGFDWTYKYCNDSAVRFYRLSNPCTSGLTLAEIFPGFSDTELYRDMEYCMNSRESLRKEYEFTFNDSSQGFLELSMHPSPEGIFVLTLDVTRRKIIEKELVNKCVELESIFENMINAFVVWESVFDESGRYVSFRFGHFNKAYSDIAGVEMKDVTGKDVFEVWPETEQEWVEVYGDIAVTGKSRTFEMFHKPTDGYYHCNAYRPTDSKSQVCVIFEDITERKKNEEIIRKGLEEKETLLRELYHRTKNNMQVIYGILALQAEMSDNEEFRLLVQDTNNRIMSMSLVHQMLYKSQNLSVVNLHDYITDLVSQLTKGFDIRDDRIEVRLDIDPVPVMIDTAIPCGLILNELISNAFKHAFPDGRKGRLSMTLKSEKDNSLVIVVEDNGVGVPPGFDYYTCKTLGLQLIISITEQQLNGSVKFESDHGMKCSIRLPDPKKDSRV